MLRYGMFGVGTKSGVKSLLLLPIRAFASKLLKPQQAFTSPLFGLLQTSASFLFLRLDLQEPAAGASNRPGW